MKKKLIRSTIVVGISFMLALFSAALMYVTPPALQLDFPAAAFFQEPTPTPQVKDVSEIGSTDGIIVLGGVLVLIVIVPIFLYRKSWMHISSS